MYTPSKNYGSQNTERFHSITEKSFWIMKRSIPDIDTGAYFLCTRVQEPTTEDAEKIIRVLIFLKATKNNQRIFGTDNFLKF